MRKGLNHSVNKSFKKKKPFIENFVWGLNWQRKKGYENGLKVTVLHKDIDSFTKNVCTLS